jgi:hypothetical protein
VRATDLCVVETRWSSSDAQNDFFYLPQRLKDEFMILLKPFAEVGVWHEAVFPTVVRTLPVNETVWNIPEAGATWFWHGDRENWRRAAIPSTYAFHPLKLSSPDNQMVVHECVPRSCRCTRSSVDDCVQVDPRQRQVVAWTSGSVRADV